VISLIQEMAANNRLWGAERIRGELLKLDIRVSKRTIQKYMRQIRSKRARGQSWRTFLRNHTAGVWACDFLQVTDLFFRPLFAFFIVELKSRRVIHVNVTRSPTDLWVVQQLREATPYGQAPKYLIRDNDRKFGPSFAHVAVTSGIKVLRTPYRTPQVNAVCERFLGSVRRECLDHFLISRKNNSPVSSKVMFCTSTRHDLIKDLSSEFPIRQCVLLLRKPEKPDHCHARVGGITS
jgi:putative transposase